VSTDEHYRIDTPENIAFSYDVAGIGSRFLAALLDTLLLLFLQFVLFVVLIGALAASDASDEIGDIVLAIFALLSFGFLWGYFLFFEMIWNGQSPGKRLARLRVVREGGRPVTFVASAIRNLIRIIDFLPSLYALGLLTMFIDKRSRRLGDLAGGTLVVKERQAVTLQSLVTRAEALPSAQDAAANDEPLLPNMHLLDDETYDLVQDFLRRRGELRPERRAELGRQLAEQLSARLDLSYNRSSPEPFLNTLVRDYRRSRQPAAPPPEQGDAHTEQGDAQSSQAM
jgi:uncharacterized RDD family membrane protein YckC